MPPGKHCIEFNLDGHLVAVEGHKLVNLNAALRVTDQSGVGLFQKR